jgi:hypothetical protein
MTLSRTQSGAERLSSLAVRSEVERLMAKDLLGPWLDDEREVLPQGSTPGERYILGVLSPHGAALDAGATDVTAKDDGTGDGADEAGAAAAAGSMSPASRAAPCGERTPRM